MNAFIVQQSFLKSHFFSCYLISCHVLWKVAQRKEGKKSDSWTQKILICTITCHVIPSLCFKDSSLPSRCLFPATLPKRLLMWVEPYAQCRQIKHTKFAYGDISCTWWGLTDYKCALKKQHYATSNDDGSSAKIWSVNSTIEHTSFLFLQIQGKLQYLL